MCKSYSSFVRKWRRGHTIPTVSILILHFEVYGSIVSHTSNIPRYRLYFLCDELHSKWRPNTMKRADPSCRIVQTMITVKNVQHLTCWLVVIITPKAMLKENVFHLLTPSEWIPLTWPSPGSFALTNAHGQSNHCEDVILLVSHLRYHCRLC